MAQGTMVAQAVAARRLGQGRVLESDMGTELAVICPYCGEEVTIYLEPDIIGAFVQDCEVCCNPWLLRVQRDAEERHVSVSRADGSE